MKEEVVGSLINIKKQVRACHRWTNVGKERCFRTSANTEYTETSDSPSVFSPGYVFEKPPKRLH